MTCCIIQTCIHAPIFINLFALYFAIQLARTEPEIIELMYFVFVCSVRYIHNDEWRSLNARIQHLFEISVCSLILKMAAPSVAGESHVRLLTLVHGSLIYSSECSAVGRLEY